tara:strand:+ start:438 stop:767 length:330 start_codon:yes stop_codon:yes gene_type:complete
MSAYMSAAEARKKTSIDSTIHGEIIAIETQIITDVAAGNLESTIATGTTMTTTGATAQSYYNVWQGSVDDRSKKYQMDRVVKYFQDAGYTIERQTDATTTNTFDWKIYW